MKRYYCTYFDRNYLAKALALHTSLSAIDGHDFELHVVCLDELTRTILKSLNLKNVKLMALHELENSDPDLVPIRQSRTLIEYYWTLTPVIVNRILLDNPHIDILTYVDADLYFFSSPEPIFNEIKNSSVLICEHKFSPEVAHVEPTSGKYNVGLVSFRSDSNGFKVLLSWRKQCLEWCGSAYADGKYADQLYLNDWPATYKGVVVCSTYGAAIGPWNHTLYQFEGRDRHVTVNGKPLVFYHFHALLILKKVVFLPALHLDYKMFADFLCFCFIPYIEVLQDAFTRITTISPDFSFGFDSKADVTAEHIMLMRSNIGFTDPLNRKPLMLDRGWIAYHGKQLVGEKPVPGVMNEGLIPIKPEDLNKNGEIVLQHGNSDLALMFFIQALALSPNLVRTHENLAKVYGLKKMFEKQEEHIKLAQKSKTISFQTDNMQWPKITLVTPSFNQAQYLEECIKSILDQRYPSLEYIIMDGGSTDGSVDIIKKYSSNIFYWQSKPDGGQYAAVEAGFACGTGEILAWLNSDDLLQPGSLFLVAKIFLARPDVEWIMGRPTVYNKRGEISSVANYLPPWSRALYLEGRVGPPHIQQESTFWRRSLYEKAGNRIEKGLNLAGDCELWARFFRHTRLYIVDALLSGFRRHESQKTSVSGVYEAETLNVVEQERSFYKASTDKTLLPAPPAIRIPDIISNLNDKLSVDAFPFFIYSRMSHFTYFRQTATEYFDRAAPQDTDDIRVYQELLIITFIRDIVPKGSRILEIGDSGSRMPGSIGHEYEWWRLDNIEGVEGAPKYISSSNNRIIHGSIGKFHSRLPNGYFDFVFSISCLQDVPEDNALFHDICRDIDRLLKDKGLSLHCFKIRVHEIQSWTSGLLPFMIDYFAPVAPMVPLSQMFTDPDAHFMKETAYNMILKSITKQTYEQFGSPASYNVLWKKNDPLSLHRQKQHFKLNLAGEEAFHRGELEKAKNLFEDAIKSNADFSLGHNNLGATFFALQDITNALKSFKRAISLDPSNSSAMHNCLDLVYFNDRYEKLKGESWPYLYAKPDDEMVWKQFIETHEIYLRKLYCDSRKSENGFKRNRSYLVTSVLFNCNSIEMLRSMLDDLESQTISDKLEIIVVDTSSTDLQSGTVTEFQERYGNIRHITVNKNINKYELLNIGIYLASGEYVVSNIMHSRMNRNTCEVLSGFLKSHPDISMVYGNNEKKSTSESTAFSLTELLFTALSDPFPMWQKAIHGTIGYFNDNYNEAGEQDFWLRVSQKFNISCLKEIPNQLNKLLEEPYLKPIALMEIFNIQVIYQKRMLFDKGILYTLEQMNILLRRYLEIIIKLLNVNEPRSAMRFYKKHRRLFPMRMDISDIDNIMSGLPSSIRDENEQ